MKDLFILIMFIAISTAVSANDFCLQFQSENQGIEKLILLQKDKKTVVEVTLYKDDLLFNNTYRCQTNGGLLHCSGDDDSGLFILDRDSKALKIENMTFGEPDSTTVRIPKIGPLEGSKCQ